MKDIKERRREKVKEWKEIRMREKEKGNKYEQKWQGKMKRKGPEIRMLNRKGGMR